MATRDSRGRFTSGEGVDIPINLEGNIDGQLADINRSFSDSFGGMAGTVTGVNQALEIVSKVVRTVAAGFKLAAEAIEITATRSMEFETSIVEVSTLVDDSFASTKRLTEITNQLSRTYGSLPTQSAQALYQTISAGAQDAGAATEFLASANKLARVGVADLNSTVTGMASTLNAYGLNFSEAERVSNAFFVAVRNGVTKVEEISSSIGRVSSTAAAMNVSVEELLASIATMTASGLQTSRAVTGLSQALANVRTPTKDAVEEAKRLGIEFNSTALRSQGLEKFLLGIMNSANFSKTSFEKLFGSTEALNAILALTTQNGASFAKNLKAQAENAGTVDREFEKVSKTLRMQVDRYVALKEQALITLGDMTNESKNARSAIEGVNQVLEDFIAFLKTGEGKAAMNDFFGVLITGGEATLAAFKAIVDFTDVVTFSGESALTRLSAQIEKSINTLELYRSGTGKVTEDVAETLAKKFVEAEREIIGIREIFKREGAKLSAAEKQELLLELAGYQNLLDRRIQMTKDAGVDFEKLKKAEIKLRKELLQDQKVIEKKENDTGGSSGGISAEDAAKQKAKLDKMHQKALEHLEKLAAKRQAFIHRQDVALDQAETELRQQQWLAEKEDRERIENERIALIHELLQRRLEVNQDASLQELQQQKESADALKAQNDFKLGLFEQAAQAGLQTQRDLIEQLIQHGEEGSKVSAKAMFGIIADSMIIQGWAFQQQALAYTFEAISDYGKSSYKAIAAGAAAKIMLGAGYTLKGLSGGFSQASPPGGGGGGGGSAFTAPPGSTGSFGSNAPARREERDRGPTAFERSFFDLSGGDSPIAITYNVTVQGFAVGSPARLGQQVRFGIREADRLTGSGAVQTRVTQ